MVVDEPLAWSRKLGVGAVSLAGPGRAGEGAEVAEDTKLVEVGGCKSGGSGGAR